MTPTREQEAEPIVLMVYRWPDGRTQVRAPDLDDHETAIDMLQQALLAMTEGEKVTTQ
jgi:hypothetical protein